jgi:hypothetical protein
MQGQCNKDQGCTFAHGEKELRGLPNFKKTRLCIPFKTGECPRASADCNYAHGETELKKLAYDYFPQQQQKNREERGERSTNPHPPPRYEKPYREEYRDRERDSR